MNRWTKVLGAVTFSGAALFLGGHSINAAISDADNAAKSKSANEAATAQGGEQHQDARSHSGNDGCSKDCAGGGGNTTPQEQGLGQDASTGQGAESEAVANQSTENVSAPVAVNDRNGHSGNHGHDDGHDPSGHSDSSWGSGNPWSGGSATVEADNSASSHAGNSASTDQQASQNQSAQSSSGNSGCTEYCAGGGGNLTPQDQYLDQNAETSQDADSSSHAVQQILNVNVPITVVGWGSIGSSGGSAELVAFNDARSSANNDANTEQAANQSQQASSSSGNTGCTSYCTGGGGNITPQSQTLGQNAGTTQNASSDASARQEVLNVNVPITIVGWGSVGSSGGSATVAADNSARSGASNEASTTQDANQGQEATSSSGNTGCTSYCTGGGGNITPQSQSLGQNADTTQGATSQGTANQGASNTASPVLVG